MGERALEPKQDQNAAMRAAIYCVLAMAGVSVIDNFVSVISDEIGLVQFHVTRAVIAGSVILVVAWAIGARIRPASWRSVGLRSILVACAMTLYFGALGTMPIAQALAGLYTAPLWVLALSALVLGYRIGPWRIGAVLFGFAGVLLVLQPDPADLGATAVLPLAAGIFYALGALVTRELCAKEATFSLLLSFFVTIGTFGLIATAMMGPDGAGEGFLLRGWVWPSQTAWGVITFQAVGTIGAIFLLTRAYQLAQSAFVAGFEFTALIFAPLIAFVLWGQPVGGLAIAGIGMIIVAGAVVAYRELRA